jgi:hypothetical protein
MSLQSAVQHISASLAAFVAAQLLDVGPGGRLLHMPRVLILAGIAGAVLPLLLWQVERRVRARIAQPVPVAALPVEP